MNYTQQANTLKGNAEMASRLDGYKESSSLFEKAGSYYKMGKEWNSAGDVFRRAAEDSMNFSTYMAAVNFTKAGELYAKCENEAAVMAFENGIENWIDNNRMIQAARAYSFLGEFHAKKERPVPAIESHSAASDLYDAENRPAACAVSRRKAGVLSSMIGDYRGGAIFFEEVAKGYLRIDSALSDCAIPEYLFGAMLCNIAAGAVGHAKGELCNYSNDFPMFRDTKEEVLIVSICDALDGDNFDSFMKNRDLSNFRPWQKVLLENWAKIAA